MKYTTDFESYLQRHKLHAYEDNIFVYLEELATGHQVVAFDKVQGEYISKAFTGPKPFGKSQEIGKKFDKGKVRYELIPAGPLKEVARVLTFGAERYDDNNWQKVTPTERYLGALMRHVEEYRDPGRPNIDSDSGLHHLAHAATNALFLLWFELKESK